MSQFINMTYTSEIRNGITMERKEIERLFPKNRCPHDHLHLFIQFVHYTGRMPFFRVCADQAQYFTGETLYYLYLPDVILLTAQYEHYNKQSPRLIDLEKRWASEVKTGFEHLKFYKFIILPQEDSQ